MKKTREFSQNGICHLFCEQSLPVLPEGTVGERIGALIEEMLRLAMKRAEAALPMLCERYEKDENPKKHLLHRPLFLSLSFTLEDAESKYRLCFFIRLSKCGRVLKEIKKAACLDRQSGRFLYEEKEKIKKKRK